MQHIRCNYKTLIATYACLLLLLGSYLLFSSRFVMHPYTSSEFPFNFLLRFGLFWFVSFVLALVFFVLHIRMHHYTLSDADISQSVKIGTVTFIAGVSLAALTGVLFYTLT